jgi:hypothetical protein
MNVRRIHELMRLHFPPVDLATLEWINVGELDGLNVERFDRLLVELGLPEEVLVEVQRKVGAVLPRVEVAAYVQEHLGHGRIQIADHDFSAFVVVAVNGVASGWRKTSNPSFEPTPDSAAQVKR